MDDEKRALLKNISEEEARWQWDGKWHLLAPGETKPFPEWMASHALRTTHGANGPVLEIVSGDEGTIGWLQSNLEKSKKDYAAAQNLLSKAQQNVTSCEKELKIAQAKLDAESASRTKNAEKSAERPAAPTK